MLKLLKRMIVRRPKMLVPMLGGKIHRATVTEANLDYVGSITIDLDLLDAAGIVPFQYLIVTNIRNGAFWETYAAAGRRGDGNVCLNGPPAHHFQPGDIIIILARVYAGPKEIETIEPKVVFVDDKNRITHTERHSLVPHPLA